MGLCNNLWWNCVHPFSWHFFFERQTFDICPFPRQVKHSRDFATISLRSSTFNALNCWHSLVLWALLQMLQLVFFFWLCICNLDLVPVLAVLLCSSSRSSVLIVLACARSHLFKSCKVGCVLFFWVNSCHWILKLNGNLRQVTSPINL